MTSVDIVDIKEVNVAESNSDNAEVNVRRRIELNLLKSPVTMTELKKSVYVSRMRTQPFNYRDVLLHSILNIDGFLLLYRTVCVALVLL
jgi:hypothetical protein